MTRPAHPALSFGIGGAVGMAGGLIGLGGAEFRLPALVGVLRFSAREAVAVNLVASFIVLAAAFPFRAASVPLAEIVPHLPAVLGMLAGSMAAAWIGAHCTFPMAQPARRRDQGRKLQRPAIRKNVGRALVRIGTQVVVI